MLYLSQQLTMAGRSREISMSVFTLYPRPSTAPKFYSQYLEIILLDGYVEATMQPYDASISKHKPVWSIAARKS